ncbi:MAG TPA: sigma-70 family RNA polymerase sigma factor [Anaerolineales bacterium]
MNPGQPLFQYNEEMLINTASRGDLDAFNQLVLRYQDLAYHHAHALLRDPALAEDATQDSFIRAFQNIAGFRGGSFRAWLLKIVSNSAYDMLRRSKRHPTQSLYPEDEYGDEIEAPVWLADTMASVQDTVEQSEFSRDLHRLIDELPAAYRTVLTLVDLYDFDYAEVANALKIPIGTVKSRLARARLKMSKKLSSVKNRPCCLYEAA